MRSEGTRARDGHLSLRGIRKLYGETVAVDRLDLEVEPGELVVLLGPSGSGKTTVLRLVAGLEEPTAGSVYQGAEEITRFPAHRRGVGMVFQHHALYPHLTAAGNISFGLRSAGLGRFEAANRVLEVARALGIERLLERYPSELSGGERQRVALGRALAPQPSLFLLDEPLSSLDAGLRASMRGEVRRLQRRLRSPTLYVTHDQAEAMALADRLAVIHQGRLEQVGTPEEIYRAPRTAFVAGFLGSPPMNLIPARLAREGGRLLLFLPGASSGLPLPGAGPLADPGPLSRSNGLLLAGVRPEDLRLAAPGEGGLSGRLVALEPLGRERVALVDLPGADGRVERLQALLPAEAGLRVGGPVWFRLEPSALRLFDPSTGQALGAAPL